MQFQIGRRRHAVLLAESPIECGVVPEPPSPIDLAHGGASLHGGAAGSQPLFQDVNKVRSGYSQGFITSMKSPSPHRLSPFCRHFGDCGGCTWQTLPYPMQLAFKQQQVVDQLSRIGHLQLPEISPILVSEKTDHYRNKLEYTFSNRRWLVAGEDWTTLSDTDRLGLGFHVSGFFDKVLDIKECHLQREPSNAIRLFINPFLY